MHERARDMLLGAWGRWVTTHPWMTLVACLLLAGAATALTVARLQFRADRSDLVADDLEWNQRYAVYKQRFPRWDDVIVCLEGDRDDHRIDDLARRVAEVVEAGSLVDAADAGFRLDEVGPHLFAAAPPEIFRRVLEQLGDARRVMAAGSAAAMLADTLQRMAAAGDQQPAALDELEALLRPYLDALHGRPADFAFLYPDAHRWLPLVSSEGAGRIRFIQVQLAASEGRIDAISADLADLRSRIASVIAESDIDVAWGVTGIPAIEADETAQSIRDSTLASIVAFALITLLMLAVFRNPVVPVLAAGSLLVGLAWSFGFLVLTVGHLQLLSVVFSVILLGLGIDFALHLVARLELVRDEHETLQAATARVFRGIGPGMLTGALTTAAAFGATALTKFKGMAEMGIIAGGGILLCLVAVLCAFPAALAVTGRWKALIRHRPGGELRHFANGRLDAIDHAPRRALLLALLAVVALAVPATRVRYDPNVLNLHPPDIESVVWERRVVEEDARSVWAGLIQTTEAEAPGLVDRLRALPEVSDVGAMGVLFPADRLERAARIAAVRDAPAPTDLPATALGPQLNGVRAGLERRAAGADATTAARLRGIATEITGALDEFGALGAAARRERLDALEAAFTTARQRLAAWVDACLAPLPIDAEDLPAVLREQWIATDADGSTHWLLRVYPTADPEGRSILDPQRLGQFVEAVRAVDPDVHGPPVQIYESSELIKREYIKAAIYAVAALLFLLLLDFRSLADSLCAMLPVTIGFIGAFGLMGAFGVPLNFANIIVLPLIFGIGVDAGVHIVHRWRAEPQGRPAGLSGGTGRGVTLTMLTTIIGFGSMLLAEHRGIRSLGFVMVTGLGVTLAACYVALPPLLRLRGGQPAEGG